jgi:signal transduction histidine kinase
LVTPTDCCHRNGRRPIHTDGVRQPLPTERTVLQGLSIARWGAVVWMVATTILQRKDIAQPWLAVLSIGLSIAVAAYYSATLRKDPARLFRWPAIAMQIALSFFLYAADGWVYDIPDIAALATGTAFGPWWGAAAGALIGLGRVSGAFADKAALKPGDVLSVLATMVFMALAGFLFGFITRLLRRVETEVVAVKARADVARTLHDGVLQTLALVERRTRESDPELASVARQSDRQLRAWLFHGDEESGDLSSRLHAAADRVSAQFDIPITVSLVVDDDIRLEANLAHALAGAAGEAMMNAAKHASPSTIVVFAEVDEDNAFVSVRDDGCGFDPATAQRGQGLNQSIEARMAEVGGRAAITSAPGEGTEIQLWTK